jgi:hypothetical protein
MRWTKTKEFWCSCSSPLLFIISFGKKEEAARKVLRVASSLSCDRQVNNVGQGGATLAPHCVRCSAGEHPALLCFPEGNHDNMLI